MKKILNIIFTVLGLLISSDAYCGVVTSLILKENDGVTTVNYPLTFGHVFKKGDVSSYVTATYNGNPVTTQCDVKATYDDGSVRFAVISIILPSIVANSSNNITLSTSTTTASTGYMTKTAILATNVNDEVRLNNISGSGYSGNLTANLNSTLSAAQSLSYWLQGSVATEVLARQSLNNSLDSSWEVRFYPGTSFGPRISHSIENMNADYRGIVNYDVEIQSGLPTLSSKYSKTSVQHVENSRWRKVLWVGNEPPETELHYDTSYIISTGAVMNYDTSLAIPESTIATTYSSWSASPHDIMGNGLIVKYFPTTGSRQEIAPLPTWSVRYLLTWDNRLREMVINHGEMYAHAPIHYRENDSSKSFYMHPISIDDRPTVWTAMDMADSYGNNGDKLPAPIGLFGSAQHGWSVDHAHQSSQAYIPYLITGDRYFLDEMYYWAGWSLSACEYGDEWGRNYSNGTLNAGVYNSGIQTRGVAWAFRNIVDAAAFAPNQDIEKQYFEEKIGNMITKYASKSNEYPLKFWNMHSDVPQEEAAISTEFNTINGVYVKNHVSPWMNDFLLLSLTHGKEQGYDTSTIISWFSSFIINRFTAEGFNNYNGAPYHLVGRLSNGTYLQSFADMNQWMKSSPTSFVDDGSADNYRFNAMAALSTVTAYSKGQDAYDFLKANVPNQSALNNDPTWAIVPRAGVVATCGTDAALCVSESECTSSWPSYYWCGSSCQANACSTPGVGVRPWTMSGRIIAPSGRPIAP